MEFFDPDSDLNRAMMVRVLWSLEGSPAASGGDYSDVASGSWYYSCIQWGTSVGIVDGYPGDTFGPEQSITRQEIADMLYRYAQYKGMTPAPPAT